MKRFIFICLLVISSPAFAESTSPFFGPILSRTQHPLLLQFLSLMPSAAETFPKGRSAVSIQTVHTNLLERKTQNTDIGIDLDMELWRTSLIAEYGISDDFDLLIEIPFLHSSGGFLDAFVQNYHDAFGFPNGGRSEVDNDRFAYTVTQNGNTLYEVSEADWTPSDWTLALKTPLYRGKRYRLTVQNLLKLPIGNRDDGSGNGGLDFGFSFINAAHWAWFQTTSQIGPVFTEGHEDLDPILHTAFLQWVQSFEFKLARTLSLLIQAQGSTPVFKDTQNDELSTVPLDLVIGFSGIGFERGDRHVFWQVAFGEDPLGKGLSLDFSSYIRLGYQF